MPVIELRGPGLLGAEITVADYAPTFTTSEGFGAFVGDRKVVALRFEWKGQARLSGVRVYDFVGAEVST